MENTINQRISKVHEYSKLSISNFGKGIRKSYTAVESVLKGKTKPGYDFLEALISAYPELNPTWLITGSGEMFPKNSTATPADEYLKEHLQTLEENFKRLANQLETKDKQIEGLQRTVDALISRPVSKPDFRKPATTTGKVPALAAQNQIMPISA